MNVIPKSDTEIALQGQTVFTPAVRIDSAMRILYANPAAEMCGLRAGDVLHPAYGAGERLRHEAAFHRSPLTRYDPLGTPQNAALYELENTCGFRLAYVEYTYIFQRCSAVAVLFRTKAEYLRFAAVLESGPRRYGILLRRALRTLREECRRSIASPDQSPISPDTVEEMLTVTMLTLECFYPDTLYTEGKRLYSLRRLVEEYLNALSRYTAALSIHLDILPPQEGADMYTSLDPECLYLILSALLSALSDLSDDHTASVFLTETGEDRSIYIRTGCRRLCRILHHTTDVQSLAVGAPRKEMYLTMAEYLCGYCGYEIHVFGEEESGLLTLQLYMPAHPAQTDFKAPLYTDAHLENTLCAICRLFGLMNADQQKKDHNDIHRPLVLSTEEKQ